MKRVNVNSKIYCCNTDSEVYFCPVSFSYNCPLVNPLFTFNIMCLLCDVYFQALLTSRKALFMQEEIVLSSSKSAVDQKTTKRRFVEKI